MDDRDDRIRDELENAGLQPSIGVTGAPHAFFVSGTRATPLVGTATLQFEIAGDVWDSLSTRERAAVCARAVAIGKRWRASRQITADMRLILTKIDHEHSYIDEVFSGKLG